MGLRAPPAPAQVVGARVVRRAPRRPSVDTLRAATDISARAPCCPGTVPAGLMSA